MNILYTKKFKKGFQKLKDGEKKKFVARIEIFMENTYSPLLSNHPLHGKYIGYRSINITGNFRVIYKELDRETFLFAEIGTHTELYKK